MRPCQHLVLIALFAPFAVAAPRTVTLHGDEITGDAAGFTILHAEGRWQLGQTPLGPEGELTANFAGLPAAPVTLGLSDGDPDAEASRALQIKLSPEGHLARFNGTEWVTLGRSDGGTLTLRLSRRRGEYDLLARSADGQPLTIERLPFENQVIFCDTLFVEGLGPAARVTLTVDDFPAPRPRPALSATALPGARVRLSWAPAADSPAGYRLYRDGALLASPDSSATGFTDGPLSSRTAVDYRLEELGVGWSDPVQLVTGPLNERPLTTSSFDALVYAATPSGIAAALSLARQGRRVALVEPSGFIGGMITGGLGRTDFGSIHALGGLFKDFMDTVVAWYTAADGADSANVQATRQGLYFEPSVARQIFLAWLEAEPNLTLYRGAQLVGVKRVGGVVNGVVLQDRQRNLRHTVAARVFVDSSYEGDLAAYAGSSYLVGREPREAYDETLAGKLWWDVWTRKIVQVEGTGDRIVQAYCYRLCLTRQPDDRLPPPPPRHYERSRYLTLVRDIEREKLKSLKDILSILPLPGQKTDANNHPQGDPSSDLIGGADDYPEAAWAEREAIAARHVDHLLGLLWFLRTDSAVPDWMRRDAQRWGLSRSEFPELAGWSSQLYVREGRRILGDHVFTEHDAMAVGDGLRAPIHRDSIAVGAYPIDSHATGGRPADNPDLLEGFFYLHGGETKPYHIPYGVMLPAGLDNVLVAGCVSSTHIGYGTLRMEPVFMGLGTAAGLAADLALAGDGTTRQVPLEQLQLELLHRGQVITVFEDVGPETVGRDGFNLFGTFGAFPTYQAQPDEALTGTALADWLASIPYPGWSADAAGLTASAEPLSGPALNDALARLATAHRLAPPRALAGETVPRAEAMAALWSLLARALGATG